MKMRPKQERRICWESDLKVYIFIEVWEVLFVCFKIYIFFLVLYQNKLI